MRRGIRGVSTPLWGLSRDPAACGMVWRRLAEWPRVPVPASEPCVQARHRNDFAVIVPGSGSVCVSPDHDTCRVAANGYTVESRIGLNVCFADMGCPNTYESMIRVVYSILLACTLTITAKAQEAAGDRLPNIILLIGDDHGFPYFGFTGSEHVYTPHMDRLARDGAVFLLGHVTDNHCRPSLQTLVTGLYPLQYQALVDHYHAEATRDNGEYQGASLSERRDFDMLFRAQALRQFETLPALLARRGYVSFQGGKWWESSFENGRFTDGMSKEWPIDQHGKPGWFRSMMGGEGMTLGRKTLQPVKDFIARHRAKPFFV